MNLSDEEFRKAHKPIAVAAHFNDAHTNEEKVVYALGQVGEGTAQKVSQFLATLNKEEIGVAAILRQLFRAGRIRARDINGELHFDLGKITAPNDGAADPDLLAPGLD